jgi:hypothetical protein|tara:strand:- start:122 stop:625 length:504 start_codon:yes stop_codon:yes gene_type:complete
MWIVAKYKINEFYNLKDSFSKILDGKAEFYNPKIKYQKYINNKLKIYSKNILDNYLFCRHDEFVDKKKISLLKNSRGLIYFLQGCESNQKNLNNFVEFCKSNEDSAGFLKQSFFSVAKKTKGQFISGPFTQMFFDILEDKEKKLKVLLNNINVTISKNSSNLLYSSI